MPNPAADMSPATAAPDIAAGRGHLPNIRALAEQFASEPEMILAYLEPLAPDSPEMPLIWAAAERAARDRPDYADVHYFAAHAAVQVGDVQRARELLNNALRINPQYDAALILGGRICLQQNEYEGALRHLLRAVAAGADYPDVHVMLGDAWQGRGAMDKAAAAYRRALAQNAGLIEARQKLAALGANRAGGRA